MKQFVLSAAMLSALALPAFGADQALPAKRVAPAPPLSSWTELYVSHHDREIRERWHALTTATGPPGS
jgi:hypothetical protein